MVWLVAVALAMVLASDGSGPRVSREAEIAPEVRTGASAPAALVFEDVEVPSNRPVIVRVFANLPEGATDVSPKSPHYLGYFAAEAVTRSGPPEPRKLRATVRLGRKTLPFGQPLRVTLVPVDGRGVPIMDITIGVGRIVLTGDRQP